ncbi:MAG: methyltransferase domain-containing protein [Prosthecobacter sp.]|jgi:phosphatidylethanolamine/phosphatidyl-N-methylethanolamine N-methyltransferase|uniref:class I SAM-dependent methyltransferase n=1 Tax=Prosthecobacter sp. TaxID=1965333 RepID=UPI0019EBCFAA|nr:methyltransferase domain-containing protein [Prosthecobacter sp.]MBE2284248.1 methyltransferase domain-containing protein [Prosthecobacter sp.]
MSAATFIRELRHNWKTIGAVAPSSPALAERMMEASGVWQARRILELGPGTGALTEAIAGTMPHEADYLGIELNPTFVEKLRPRFPRMRFECAGAQEYDFAQALSDDGKFDTIISGLPWTAFPRCLQEAILGNVLPHLASGGSFVTFAYWGFHQLPAGQRFRELLHELTHGVETTRVVWANLPPAFVYVARKA